MEQIMAVKAFANRLLDKYVMVHFYVEIEF